jgi:hypothetical protein
MTPEQFHALPTPRTDAAIINGEMADLELGHRHREIKDFARQLEREVTLCEKALMKLESSLAFTLPHFMTNEEIARKELASETLRTLAEVRNTK